MNSMSIDQLRLLLFSSAQNEIAKRNGEKHSLLYFQCAEHVRVLSSPSLIEKKFKTAIDFCQMAVAKMVKHSDLSLAKESALLRDNSPDGVADDSIWSIK